MATDRTVLEHLLEGRDALVLEVKRLTTAIDELDSVIAKLGGGHAPEDNVSAADLSAVSARRAAAKSPSRTRRGTARKAARTPHPAGSKSIRVHVLDMLAAEDRDFGLAEIIDRIHGQGIRAHDDAVRSITIKLMKDGQVERVGRGQYRLAHRDAVRSVTESPAAAPQGPDPVTSEPAMTEPGAPEPVTTEPVTTYVPPLNLDQGPN